MDLIWPSSPTTSCARRGASTTRSFLASEASPPWAFWYFDPAVPSSLRATRAGVSGDLSRDREADDRLEERRIAWLQEHDAALSRVDLDGGGGGGTSPKWPRRASDLRAFGVKGWTQRGRLTVLSAVFAYARERLDYPGGNPSSLLSKAERPGVDDQREHRILNQEEIQGMLAAADEHHRLLLATAVQTGARKAEVLGLTWADVDVAGRTVHIERQLDRQGNRMALKTKRSDRTVAIPSALAAQLAERRLASGASANALVFARLDGTPYSHSAADRALAKAIKGAHLEHASWHDLRHTHVSLLFAAGRDLVSIAARVGDSIQTVLRTYAHEYEAARRRA